ncbi:MAG: DedA family protein [Panacagrimonas sp.]
MEKFLAWVEAIVSELGYVEIMFLMALESSLFPVPSELVMIPAGYLAATGQLDPWLAIGAGTLGSLIGASCNYLLGMTLGRAFLLRYGRYVFIGPEKYQRAERLFLRNARMATFIGRLLPVIRHLISLPAGVFRMPLIPFVLLTSLGAAIWCAVLVACGYWLGEPALALIMGYTHEVAIVSVICLAIFILWFLLGRERSVR